MVHNMACSPIGLHWLGLDNKDPRYSPVARGNHRWPWFPAQRNNDVENAWNHQRTIICIQNRLLFCLIGSVNDLDSIACPNVSSLWSDCDGVWHGYHRYLWDFSIIFIRVTTDVMGDNWCGRFGLWPFRSVAVPVCGCYGLWPLRFVAVPVCGRFGLWPFRFVAVSVCGRSRLWPFRSVAVSVCGRFGLWPFRLWPFQFVAVMTCYLVNNILPDGFNTEINCCHALPLTIFSTVCTKNAIRFCPNTKPSFEGRGCYRTAPNDLFIHYNCANRNLCQWGDRFLCFSWCFIQQQQKLPQLYTRNLSGLEPNSSKKHND